MSNLVRSFTFMRSPLTKLVLCLKLSSLAPTAQLSNDISWMNLASASGDPGGTGAYSLPIVSEPMMLVILKGCKLCARRLEGCGAQVNGDQHTDDTVNRRLAYDVQKSGVRREGGKQRPGREV